MMLDLRAALLITLVICYAQLGNSSTTTEPCSQVAPFHSLTPTERSAELICRTSAGQTCSSSSGGVTWRKDGRAIDDDSLPGVRYASGGAVVVLDNARPVHEGNWTCHSEGRSSEPLTFSVPPYRPHGNVVGRLQQNLGGNFTLSCDVVIGAVTRHVDGYEVTWSVYRLGGELIEQLLSFDSQNGVEIIASNVQYHDSNFSVDVTNFTTRYPRDGGEVYRCRVVNKRIRTWEVSAMTRVSFQPACLAVSMGLEEFTFLKPHESRIVFTVKFTGCVDLVLSWRLGARSLDPPSSPRHTLRRVYDGITTTVYLSIIPVEEEDGGLMTVEASGCNFQVATSTTIVLQSVPHSVAISPRPCELSPEAPPQFPLLNFTLPHPLPRHLMGQVEIELLLTDKASSIGTSQTQQRANNAVAQRFAVTSDIGGQRDVRVSMMERLQLPLSRGEFEGKFVVQIRLLVNGSYLVEDWSPFCNSTNTFSSRKCERVELSLKVVAREPGDECSEEEAAMVGITSELEATLNSFHVNKTIASTGAPPCHAPAIVLTNPTLECSTEHPTEGVLTVFASGFAMVTDTFIAEFKQGVLNGSIRVSSGKYTTPLPQQLPTSQVRHHYIIIGCLAAAILVVIATAVGGCVISYKCRQRRKTGGGGGGEGGGGTKPNDAEAYPENFASQGIRKTSQEVEISDLTTTSSHTDLRHQLSTGTQQQDNTNHQNKQPTTPGLCTCNIRLSPTHKPTALPGEIRNKNDHFASSDHCKVGPVFNHHGGSVENSYCSPQSTNVSLHLAAAVREVKVQTRRDELRQPTLSPTHCQAGTSSGTDQNGLSRRANLTPLPLGAGVDTDGVKFNPQARSMKKEAPPKPTHTSVQSRSSSTQHEPPPHIVARIPN